jgi:aminomethyltransferase
VPFAGWEMPIEYSGIAEEHLAVRERAGLFDVSHMGEIEIAGRDALAAVQRVSCNDASKLAVGQAQYSGLMSARGTFVDDLVVYRLAAQHFLLVVNASRVGDDYMHIAEEIKTVGDAVAVDASSRYALIALQGPRSSDVLQQLTGVDLSSIKPYWFAHGEVAGVRATMARTGYTGEDGFEMFVPPAAADRVWMATMDAGRDVGVAPCGLGARDTLRLEAGLRLYGNDIDDQTTPIEAGLRWIVGWDKGEFLGADVLRRQRSEGVKRKLVGFEMIESGIARQGYAASVKGEPVGAVTSGTRTPYLKKAVGMAFVAAEYAAIGEEFDVDIRGRLARAQVVQMPFYKRTSGATSSTRDTVH